MHELQGAMRELKKWGVVALTLAALWAVVVVLARTIVYIPPNEPPDAFGIAPVWFMLAMAVLMPCSATFLIAGSMRGLFLLARTTLRRVRNV